MLQIQAALGKSHYDISDEGLVIWPDETGYRTKVVYPLRGTRLGHFIRPRVRGIPPVAEPRPLDERMLLFRHHAITWTASVSAWDAAEHAAGALPRLVSGPSLLP